MKHRAAIRMSGFTLIELLIVVAIIAILAAIAVPNFLEAQVRAKVSRTHADMRSIATAMESYMVDYNSYPLPWDNGSAYRNITSGAYFEQLRVVVALSTPVSYITSGKMKDPFSKGQRHAVSTLSEFMQFGCGTWGNPAKNSARAGNIVSGNYSAAYSCNAYLIVSEGPNAATGMSGGDNTYRLTRYPTGTEIISYDGTNGTNSTGDIHRFGPQGMIPEGIYRD